MNGFIRLGSKARKPPSGRSRRKVSTAAADLEQFRADVDADAVVAGLREQRRERAGAAAEINDARAARQRGELHEGVDDARIPLRREHVVIVRGGMAVEERDFFLFVL